MSIKNLSVEEINAHKDDTIKILQQQKEMLQKLDNELIKEASHKKSNEKDKGILTLEKSKDFQQILQSEITKLEKFDVVLAVVGTMKAGKSTTINAIVGREILPNRNRPMTSLPTLICHTPNQTIPTISLQPEAINNFLSKVKTNLNLIEKSDGMHEDMQKLIEFINNGGQFDGYYEGEEKIFEFLYQLNDLVRLTTLIALSQNKKKNDKLTFPFEQYKNFENLPRINVEFNLEQDFNTAGRFMLLDTAGPNEAGQKALEDALKEQLARSSAVMIVLDYTQLNSKAEEDVKNEIDAIPSIQKSRLFALVNKFDQKNSNADEADATRNHIYHNLLQDKIELENIYAISAQDSYLANRMLTYINIHNGLPTYAPNTWVEDFAKKVYGEMAEEMYPESNIEMIKKGVTKIITRSRMQEPMQNVIGNMQKNAPFIAMQSALAGASHVFDSLYNSLNARYAIQQMNTEAELNALHQTAENLKKQIKELNKKKSEITTKLNDFASNIEKEANLEDSISLAKDNIQEVISKTVHNHTEYFERKTYMDRKNEKALSKNKPNESHHPLSFKGILDSNNIYNSISRNKTIPATNLQNKELTFRTNGWELPEFHKTLKQLINDINTGLVKDFEQIMQQQAKYVEKQLGEINNASQAILDNLRDDFKKSNISLRLEYQKFTVGNRTVLDKHELDLTEIAKHTPITHYEDGIVGTVKTFFGNLFNADWGSYPVDYTVYKTDDIIKILESLTNRLIEELTQQITTQIKMLVSQSGTHMQIFEESVSEIIYEIESELNNNTLRSIDEKKEYKKLIEDSKQELDNLKEDWLGVANLFDVTEIKTLP